ncbi:thymidylate synthase [Streptomyces sp. NPDC046925]|uniref:thymidylate synthase n=1 Tax=Streptomyces sp. NPDC046925 TaxID=3155375 RepID=UPI0033DBFCE7
MITHDRFADAWIFWLREIMQAGNDVTDDGERLREILNVSISAHTCRREDFIASGADEDRLNLMLAKYRSSAPVRPYTRSYGDLFTDHMAVNQVDWLVKRLRAKPETKSATIGFHIPGEDWLSCISLIDCKIRNNAMHLNIAYRSQNVLASQPGNACALRGLQEEIAAAVGVRVGALTVHIFSAHIYERDWDSARDILSRNGVTAGEVTR